MFTDTPTANIRHRPSTPQRRCVKVQRIGANYDPITSGKMDDLVSRIINVSMDLYFYYIPITVGNESAFREFRVYTPVRATNASLDPPVLCSSDELDVQNTGSKAKGNTRRLLLTFALISSR